MGGIGAIARGNEDRTFKWIVLFSLIVAFVHGMVDDYLYNGVGTMFSLFLVSLSMNGRDPEKLERRLDLRTVGAIAVIWVIVATNQL